MRVKISVKVCYCLTNVILFGNMKYSVALSKLELVIAYK